MKNKILPIILIAGLLLTSIWTIITGVNLKEAQESIRIVSQRLEQRETTLASTIDTLINTQTDLRNNQVTLTNVETKLSDTERKLSDTERKLSDTQRKLDVETLQVNDTEEALRTNKDKLDAVTVDLRNNQGELALLKLRISLIGDLEQQIKDLETKRLVLIPKTRKASFSCTGSMEPKITCMDTAVYLTNFKPEDIVLGSIVSYTNKYASPPNAAIACIFREGRCERERPLPDCPEDRISHRVINIKTENGKYFYRTKGDSNSEDDGCWIPSDYVNGYMISLTKGSDSVMEELLSRIWVLEAEVKSLELDKAEEYNQLLSKYRAYCPNAGELCILSSASYHVVENLKQRLNGIIRSYEIINEDITYKRNELESLRCSRLKLCN